MGEGIEGELTVLAHEDTKAADTVSRRHGRDIPCVPAPPPFTTIPAFRSIHPSISIFGMRASCNTLINPLINSYASVANERATAPFKKEYPDFVPSLSPSPLIN